MDLVDDFQRLTCYAFGAKDHSPEVKNALQRWCEAMKPKARARAVLNETNAVREADKRMRVLAVREAVDKIKGEGHGAITRAIRSVAKARGQSFNKVKQLYYAKKY